MRFDDWRTKCRYDLLGNGRSKLELVRVERKVVSPTCGVMVYSKLQNFAYLAFKTITELPHIPSDQKYTETEYPI